MDDDKKSAVPLVGKDTATVELAHKIAVEDDERDFKHKTYWDSCCIRMDKRAVAYLGQMAFSGAIIAFTISMLVLNQDCSTFSRYSPLLTFIVGCWMPQPQMRSDS